MIADETKAAAEDAPAAAPVTAPAAAAEGLEDAGAPNAFDFSAMTGLLNVRPSLSYFPRSVS